MKESARVQLKSAKEKLTAYAAQVKKASADKIAAANKEHDDFMKVLSERAAAKALQHRSQQKTLLRTKSMAEYHAAASSKIEGVGGGGATAKSAGSAGGAVAHRPVHASPNDIPLDNLLQSWKTVDSRTGFVTPEDMKANRVDFKLDVMDPSKKMSLQTEAGKSIDDVSGKIVFDGKWDPTSVAPKPAAATPATGGEALGGAASSGKGASPDAAPAAPRAGGLTKGDTEAQKKWKSTFDPTLYLKEVEVKAMDIDGDIFAPVMKVILDIRHAGMKRAAEAAEKKRAAEEEEKAKKAKEEAEAAAAKAKADADAAAAASPPPS